MSKRHHSPAPNQFPRAHLAACLIAALGLSTSHASDKSHAPMQGALYRAAAGFEQSANLRPYSVKSHVTHSSVPAHPSGTLHQVGNCADDGSPGSLRAVLNDPTIGSGDTIDLSQLACSTITLDGNWAFPELPVYVDDLTFKGPAAGAGNMTIDGGRYSRVLRHFGLGSLSVIDLTITNGYYASDVNPVGGCIYSKGSVLLTRSIVSNCTAKGTSNFNAAGGGIFSEYDLTLVSSTITGSHVIGTSVFADGGGACVAGDFSSLYSSITNSSAYSANVNFPSSGGGVIVLANATIQGSTISGNIADIVGGVELVGNALFVGTIINSTVSNNTATTQYGGIWTTTPLTLVNSTVAFNKASLFANGAGMNAYGTQLTLQSSIIADNVGKGEQRDVGGSPGASITAMSAKNLITSSSLPLPQDTLGDCPQLEPLADNGGGLLTHLLRHTSPAIDKGFNAGGLISDQRLLSRGFGLDVDIGSVEWHPSDHDERIFTSGLDGFCDS